MASVEWAIFQRDFEQRKRKEQEAAQSAFLLTLEWPAVTTSAPRFEQPVVATTEDEILQQVMQASLETNTREETARAINRRAEEETRRVLSGVQTEQVDAIVVDGLVVLDNVPYTRVECGSAAGDHSNVCFYLSATRGDAAAALRLKAEIAPAATELARALGVNTDFTERTRMADTEVIRAYVRLRGVVAIVFNVSAGVALRLWVEGKEDAPVHVFYNENNHFQRLNELV